MSGHSFTHLDSQGQAIMVDVGHKPATSRVAEARGEIKVGPEVMAAIISQSLKKGDVLGVARVAGIMGAKKTPELIPLCHQVFIVKCAVDFELDEVNSRVRVICRVASHGQTGVEMEALTGVSAALLAIYDMCKALDKSMVIGPIWLTEKSGGQSGDFKRTEPVDDRTAKPAAKPTAKPTAKPVVKPAAKPAPKPFLSFTDMKAMLAAEFDGKPEAKPKEKFRISFRAMKEATVAAESEAKPEATPEAKPEATPEAKPGANKSPERASEP